MMTTIISPHPQRREMPLVAPCGTCSAIESTAFTEDLPYSTGLGIDLDVSDSEQSDHDVNLKPPIPYVEGFRMSVVEHEPPEPFGRSYNTELPITQKNWAALSQTEYCLSNPFRGGRVVATDPQLLTITAIIRTGFDRGAQLVEVNKNMVAKIYDPLYYYGLNIIGRKEDVVLQANGDYSREAAAYEVLQQSAAARAVIPAFFGTWTTEITTMVGKIGEQKTHKRPVQLILMERLQGKCMGRVNPHYLQKWVRSLILKKTLHAEAVVLQAGVEHCDLAPRNVMILESNYDQVDITKKDIQLEVRLIDFNAAEVIHHPRYVDREYYEERPEDEWSPLLQSPIVRYHGVMTEFSTQGWCSNEDDAPEMWLWKHFHNDPRYIPVEWDPLKPSNSPQYQKRHTMGNGSDSVIPAYDKSMKLVRGAEERQMEKCN